MRRHDPQAPIRTRPGACGLQDSGAIADHTDDDFWQSFTLPVGSEHRGCYALTVHHLYR
jgi:hypothetical protein